MSALVSRQHGRPDVELNHWINVIVKRRMLHMGHNLIFTIFSARLSVSWTGVIPPGGQISTTTIYTTSAALAWRTGARILMPITSLACHESFKMKRRLWLQTVSLRRWVDTYWKKRGGYQRRMPTNIIHRESHDTRQSTIGNYVETCLHPPYIVPYGWCGRVYIGFYTARLTAILIWVQF